MKKFTISFLCLLFSFFGNVTAQDVSRPDSYNLTRGIEAVEEQNYQGALDFFKKEIKEHPKNGYAYAWMAVIYQQFEKYANAVSHIDLAIKYIPKKDITYRSWAFYTKSQIYEALGDVDKALEYMNEAIKVSPDDIGCYEKRAELYFDMELYDEADKDYHKILSLDESNALAYMGLGRDETMRGNFDAAVKIFDYVTKLEKDYPSAYSFRAECLIKLKRYNEAAADIVKAISINEDDKAFLHMTELAHLSLSPLVTWLKIEAKKNPTDYKWPYILGIAYEEVDQYSEAIDSYLKSYEMDANEGVAYRLANCYDEIGMYQEAMHYSDYTVRCDSTDFNYFLMHAVINDHRGESGAAIEDLDRCVDLQPDYFFGYYRRGWVKDHNGDWKGAIDDYSTSILLDPTYTYAFLNRGVLYKLQGDDISARKDFEEIVKRDSLEEESHTPYALFYLGKKDEAKAFMDALLNKSDYDGIYYEAACLYSLMKEEAQALKYLRLSLEHGDRDFIHIRRDRDLEYIRGCKGFDSLMNEFENPVNDEKVSADKQKFRGDGKAAL